MSEIVDLTNESGPVVPVEAAVVHRPRNPYSAAAAYTRGHSSATSVVQGLAVSTSTTVVSFSLVSLGEFTARIDQGPVNREILDTLKEVRGRFDADNKRWVFPCDQHDKLRVALTERHRVSVKPLPRSALVASQVLGQQLNTPSNSANFLKNKIHRRLANALAGFQKQGVEFIVKCGGRALLADEMGLGKTIQAIACAAYYRRDWPVLIITPSTARLNWQSEVLTWMCPDMIAPNDVTLVEGTSHALSRSHKIVIMSYSLLDKMAEKLKNRGFNIIIADESHYLKNSKARRTKALVPLLLKSKRAILLSGTPALSRPKELFTQLHALNNTMWSCEKEFLDRYCRTKAGSSVVAFSEFNGASNTAELHACLRGTVMLRRLKSDILHMLPPKERRVKQIPIMDPAKEVHLKDILSTISKNEDERKAAVRERKKRRVEQCVATGSGECSTETRKAKKSLLMQLFKDSGEAKVPALCVQLGAFLDDKTAGKVLVFAHHRAVLDGLSSFLSRRGTESIRIDGQTQPRDRFARVKHFQTSSVCRVALLAITAAGVSITLTAASTVYFAELFWTPGSLIQAEDRAHRIGQSATVNVNYLLSPGTIDEILWPMIHKKMRLLGEVVEGHSRNEGTDLLSTTHDEPNSNGIGTEAGQFGSAFLSETRKDETTETKAESNPVPPVSLKSPHTPDFNQLESLIEELASQNARAKKTIDDEETEDNDDDDSPWGQRDALTNAETDGSIDQPDKLAILHMQMEMGL
jgi:SWI/SNF-related matrix-associated actin-dependent regulator of chromatin subfamily A-like protein 1